MANESPDFADPPTTWSTMLYRALLIGGLTLVVGGIMGEIFFLTDEVPIHVNVTGPPEEGRVHGLCMGAACSGVFTALLGAMLWLASANSQSLADAWKSFLTALGPEGGHYDGRDKPRGDTKTNRTSDFPP